jgi:hypothetical protein
MPEPNTRTFVIPTERSVADPAWMIACWESAADAHHSHGYKTYGNYNEIKDLIHTCELKQAESVGYSKCYNDICEKFGFLSPRELDEAATAYKAKGFKTDHLPEGSH